MKVVKVKFSTSQMDVIPESGNACLTPKCENWTERDFSASFPGWHAKHNDNLFYLPNCVSRVSTSLAWSSWRLLNPFMLGYTLSKLFLICRSQVQNKFPSHRDLNKLLCSSLLPVCAQISLSGVCQSQAFKTHLGLRRCQMVVSMVLKMTYGSAKVFCLVKHRSPSSFIGLFWVDRYFFSWGCFVLYNRSWWVCKSFSNPGAPKFIFDQFSTNWSAACFWVTSLT